ncbi:MAG: isoleucyl-tRNA synthetase, partial [Gammaproteobacteria bacterium]
GIFDKSEIERQIGVAEFTRRCRESVMRYIGDWEKMTERMGFWVNLDDAYYTLNNDYIESVWHLLQVIWDKGLIYQGYKVVPYDPRIGATLSSHEVSQGYKEVYDPSIYVEFRLADAPDTAFLVWTTTPWTLPSNLALAVHPDVDYVFVTLGGEHEGKRLVLAQALCESALRDTPYSVEKVVKGTELIGMRYERLFDYLEVDAAVTPEICKVRPGEFVTIEDGTGIVHCAPAYGEDDLRLGQQFGLPVLHGVGLDGHFFDAVTPVAGKFFKEADPVIIALLTERGQMFRAEQYLHNYPHGWRTGDPLIYYAKNAWYIRTSKYRDRMVELNKTINWVPKNIRDGRFGNWLENNVDWALSRERFWGTPLPIWTDGEGDFKCMGSVAELEALCGRSLSEVDLHRPAVDELTFTHPENGREYRRVPEVIDCWFDSGAMSYAQWHYPFENKELFEERFPADFICEAIDQTRGWFYTLHAIATLVSDSVAFKNCICLAHIVDADGKKMSKSQGNIVNPYDVFDTVGADALRWYLCARIAPEAQKRISVELVRDVAKTFINTYWNTYAFFILYARLDKVDLDQDVPVDERPEIDRWILALLQSTVAKVTYAMDNYDAQGAGQAIELFVDNLSNWYLRRNRRRFWKAAAGADKQAAYLTLYESLHTVNRLMAPLMPFLTDAVHQNLVRSVDDTAPMTVHMSQWPQVRPECENANLIEAFEAVQRVVGLGRAARNDSKVRVRQPLGKLMIRVPDDAAGAAVVQHQAQILEELNVKGLELIAQDAELVSYRIKPNLPRIGKRYGKLIPAIRAALTEADGREIAVAVANGQGFAVNAGGEMLDFGPEDVLVETSAAQGYACAEEGGFLVGLDTRLNDDLLREGLARELVRTVQDARKQAGLEVSDRIALRISGDDAVVAALAEHRTFLMSETLATSWSESELPNAHRFTHTLDEHTWEIELIAVPES